MLFVFADNNRITQVIVYMLYNAIRFSLEGKMGIEVEKNKINKKAIINIKDRDLGINSDFEILSRHLQSLHQSLLRARI
ncbi:MAG: hypothetical protein ACTHLL_04995 [Candidatus Nitrosocosmicus sp.]